MEFAYDGGGLGKGGVVTLYIDGEKAGDRKIAATVPMIYSADETCDIGYDTGIPSARTTRARTAPASGMSRDGVLQEYCGSRPRMCHGPRQFDVSSFRGIFTQAVADYDLATRIHTYRPWLQAQARAILARAVSDGDGRRTRCATPHGCQFGLYWSRNVAPTSAPVPISLATQTSALQALTG